MSAQDFPDEVNQVLAPFRKAIRAAKSAKRRLGSSSVAIKDSANECLDELIDALADMEQAAESIAAQWPTPITDRPPTEADGDDYGDVQQFVSGVWHVDHWDVVACALDPWPHTPLWQPPTPPPLTPEQQEALAALDRLLQHCSDNTGEAALRRFILGKAGE